jgi:NAD(P)-dependent dehydrogenase (short-subunit alcohol dehydrogenase family)
MACMSAKSTSHQPGRVIAVTGAGTGIGRATARAFAAEGASVLAIGRRPGPLRETAAGHERITPLAADVTGTGEPERIARAARDLHGRLDVLVSNAGIVRGGTLGALSHDGIAAQLATNLTAPVLLAQAALPLLEEAGGVIVNVSTSVGQRAWPGSSVYASVGNHPPGTGSLLNRAAWSSTPRGRPITSWPGLRCPIVPCAA